MGARSELRLIVVLVAQDNRAATRIAAVLGHVVVHDDLVRHSEFHLSGALFVAVDTGASSGACLSTGDLGSHATAKGRVLLGRDVDELGRAGHD